MISSLFRFLRTRARRRRYSVISRLLRVEDSHNFILDLGGGPASFFAAIFPRPGQLVLVDVDYNSTRAAKQAVPALHVVVADAGRLPLANDSIDAVICNSVIEHVDNPAALAAEIRRVSPSFFVQTPNGHFPLETHSFIAIPFYNFLPGKRLKRLACRIFSANYAYVSSVRYLPERRLKSLFPDAVMTYERVLGLKKSFYMYRSGER